MGPHEPVATMSALEHQLDTEPEFLKAAVAQLLLKARLPPSGLVLIARPALPAIERGEYVIDGEGDRSALEVVHDIAAPHRDVRNVEIERATRLQHAPYVLEGVRDLSVCQVLDDAQRQDFLERLV